MKCPKCGYLGFETGDRCRNCGYDFSLSGTPAPPSDVPIRAADEPHGPLTDFKLSDDDAVPSPPEGRRAFEKLDLDRLIGAPAPPTDLPLFSADQVDEAPLVTPSAAPRAPLAVRRATPEMPRLKSRPAQLEAPELPIDQTTAEPIPVAASRWAPSISVAAPGKPALAGLSRRILAGALDTVVLFGIDAAVIYFTLRLCDLRLTQVGLLPITPLSAFLLLLNGGYSVAFTTVGGQTLGKMALGIKVVNDENRPIDVSHATLRTLTYLVSVLPLGLGLLPAVFGQGRRALHDRVASTRVIQINRS